MELAPLTGLADAIVDLVSSGSTLRGQPPRRGRADHADLGAPGRQPGGAEAEARADPRRSSTRSRSGRPIGRRHDARAAPARHAQRRLRGASSQRVLHWSAETDARDRGSASPRSSPTCARAATPRCSSTPRASTRSTPASVAALELTRTELRAALDAIPPAQRDALEAAAERVRSYHERQLEACGRSWSYRDADGTLLGPEGHAARPGRHLRAGRQGGLSVERADERGAGAGGRRRRDRDGGADAARRAQPAGAGGRRASPASHRVFTIGGAQAVGALAYGTATVPRVDKITGPGNAYVASAKRRVFGTVGIDMIAGPSEILVLADGTTPPDWVAMDLFSQAEHDELAQSILLCPDAGLHRRGAQRDRAPAAEHAAPRRDPRLARRPRRADPHALDGRGLRDQQPHRARAPRGQRAPSRSAGSRCCATPARSSSARYTSESLGDYCAGPNHVLPTSGTARFSSPLGVYDFQKRTSLIEVSEPGAADARPDRRRAGLRRGPAGACARGRAAPGQREGASPMSRARRMRDRIAQRSARTCSRCTATRSSRAPAW